MTPAAADGIYLQLATWRAQLGAAVERPCLGAPLKARRLHPLPHPPPPQLHGSKGLDVPWTRLGATAAAGASVLELVPSAPPTSWLPGDRLAIASTDYDPYQTEASLMAAAWPRLLL